MKLIKTLRKGQVTIFGKTISALTAVLALVVLSGVGLALLSAYITITGSATVRQSVVLNGFESTWKYPNEDERTWTETAAYWATSKAVGGDEQDVGFKLSNYAETEAEVEIESTVTCTEAGYEAGKDVVMTIWSDYTPSDNSTCTALTDEDDCEAVGYCVWDGTHCKGDEKCRGIMLAFQQEGSNTVTLTQTLDPRPSISDPSTPSERWYCIRHAWNIAAVPGIYGFNLVISPVLP